MKPLFISYEITELIPSVNAYHKFKHDEVVDWGDVIDGAAAISRLREYIKCNNHNAVDVVIFNWRRME